MIKLDESMVNAVLQLCISAIADQRVNVKVI